MSKLIAFELVTGPKHALPSTSWPVILANDARKPASCLLLTHCYNEATTAYYLLSLDIVFHRMMETACRVAVSTIIPASEGDFGFDDEN